MGFWRGNVAEAGRFLRVLSGEGWEAFEVCVGLGLGSGGEESLLRSWGIVDIVGGRDSLAAWRADGA